MSSVSSQPLPQVGPITFVDDKPPDLEYMSSLLAESRRQNQWTNFGPVSLLLEEAVRDRLDLGDDNAVVATSSGTSALHSLVALHSFLVGRPQRWVVSAFGFWCTRQGVLGDSLVVDCDSEGMLDLHSLDSLDPSEYDGVVVTNVFGLLSDISPYVSHCRALSKALICDAGAAFDAGHRRNDAASLFEAISFHHTKPWGMGEGGCLVLPAEHEHVARSLINFGTRHGAPTGRLSTNAKMSDLAAAAILGRLRDFDTIRRACLVEYQRVIDIATSIGFRPLRGDGRVLPGQGTPPCVPLVAPVPIPSSTLSNPHVVFRKYYAPVEPGHRTADWLYDRILNIPSHPGMARLRSDLLAEVLRAVLAASGFRR